MDADKLLNYSTNDTIKQMDDVIEVDSTSKTPKEDAVVKASGRCKCFKKKD